MTNETHLQAQGLNFVSTPDVLRPHSFIVERETRPDFITIGEMIADRLRNGSSLLLDVDGVLLESDSLDSPYPTSFELLDHVRGLEKMGYSVGLATARANHCIEYFRSEHGLKLAGLSILEEGQHRVLNGKTEYLSSDFVKTFMDEAHYYMQLMPEFVSSWDVVRQIYEEDNQFAFTHGNHQWQGDVRRSFWFYSNCDKESDDQILVHYFDRVFSSIAYECGLTYYHDLSVSVSHMTSGNNLGIIGLKGKKEGKPINKATALEETGGNYVFVADGMGDLPLGLALKRREGLVVGVEGNLDASKEPCAFLEHADGVVSDPNELAKAFQVARIHLTS